MIALAIIAAIIALILLILFVMPVHIVIAYDGSLTAYLRVLVFKEMIYPGKENKDLDEKEIKPAGESGGKSEKTDIVKIIGLIHNWIKTFLDKFVKRVKITVKKYTVVIGGEDAAQVALLYGAAAQASSYLFAFLYSKTKFYVSGSADPDVRADFTATKCSADIKIDLHTNVVGAIAVIMAVPSTVTKALRK